jgi:hypothetical protein
MTRTISFIIGIAVTALAVAVPTALGEGRLAGSNPQDAVTYFKANELATLVQQPIQLDRRTDAWDRTAPTTMASTYRDSIQPSAEEHGVGQYVDANQRVDLPTSPVAEPVSSSGTDFDWSQLGIGLGIGLALAFGLMLMFRAARHNRPLAH